MTMVVDFTKRSAFTTAFLSYGLPHYMCEGLRAWIEEGRRPGDFLYAMLCNDFKNAVVFVDDRNQRVLREWAQFLMSPHVPDACWGSYESVCRWEGVGLTRTQKVE